MNIDWLRRTCLLFPHVTEQVQWGNDLVFKVGGRMFAVASLEPAAVCLAFKCSDESFADLTERSNVIPAPYLARAKWIAMETRDAIPLEELEELLREAYDLAFAKLTKAAQASLRTTPHPIKKKKSRPRKNAAKTGKR